MKIKLEEMGKLADEFLSGIKPIKQALVVGLFGDLGAGKTTFTQHVAKKLGIQEIITSPTFVIMKSYLLPKDGRDPRIRGDDEIGCGDDDVCSRDPRQSLSRAQTRDGDDEVGCGDDDVCSRDFRQSLSLAQTRDGHGEICGFKNLIHIDAYRLESEKELENLGFKEILKNPQNLIFVEWPENISTILPDDMMTIIFDVVDEESREIRFKI